MQLPSFFKTKFGTASLHVLAWSIYYIREIYEYIVESADLQEVLLDISYYGLIISTFYLFYYWIWPKILSPGRYLIILPGILIGTVYFVGGRY